MAKKCNALGASPQSHTVGLQLPHGSLQFSLREKYKFPFWTMPHQNKMPAENVEAFVKNQNFMELSSRKKKKRMGEKQKLIRKKERRFRGLKR